MLTTTPPTASLTAVGIPYFDQTSQQWAADGYAKAGGFLFGRRTYELLAGYWPHAKPGEAPVAEPLNRLRKYVASRTMEPPLSWDKASLLPPDVADAVRKLKEEDGGDHLAARSLPLSNIAARQERSPASMPAQYRP